MLKKSGVHNCAILLVIVLFVVSASLPFSLKAYSTTSSNGELTFQFYQHTKYYDDANLNSNFESDLLGEMNAIPRIYDVQVQPESTISNADNGAAQSRSNGTSEPQGNNKLTSGSDLSSNNDPPMGSTGQGNLTPKPTTVKCEGSALCVTGEVVKVINGKTFYVNIQNKVYKVELALIGLPMNYEEAMRAATTFTRNSCLGSNVLIDQDDGQRENSFIAQVYCSPTKNLNALLLNTGYVQLDKSQCQTSEFAELNWAKSHGC